MPGGEGEGDLSGKACLQVPAHGGVNLIKDRRVLGTVVIFSRGVYQNYLPCSSGDWSLLYLCYVCLPLNRDDCHNSQKGPVGHECRVRTCHVGGGQLLNEV